MFFDVNIWSVIVAIVLSMVLGAIWYSQALFGKAWAKDMGVKKEASKEDMMKSYIGMIISTAITVLVLNMVLKGLGVADLRSAVEYAIYLSIGFTATYSLGGVLWAGQTWRVFFINGVYNILHLVIAAGALMLV